MKETVAGEFISRFQLKPEESQALKGTKNGPITEVCRSLLNFLRNVVLAHCTNGRKMRDIDKYT